MRVLKAKALNPELTRFDCEVELNGKTLPYTADLNDAPSMEKVIPQIFDDVETKLISADIIFEPYSEPPPPPVVVPGSISARQARLALLRINKLDAVEPAIESMPSPDKEQAQIEWEYATEIERNHPFVKKLAAGLGLTDDQIDQLFIMGSEL